MYISYQPSGIADLRVITTGFLDNIQGSILLWANADPIRNGIFDSRDNAFFEEGLSPTHRAIQSVKIVEIKHPLG